MKSHKGEIEIDKDDFIRDKEKAPETLNKLPEDQPIEDSKSDKKKKEDSDRKKDKHNKDRRHSTSSRDKDRDRDRRKSDGHRDRDKRKDRDRRDRRDSSRRDEDRDRRDRDRKRDSDRDRVRDSDKHHKSDRRHERKASNDEDKIEEPSSTVDIPSEEPYEEYVPSLEQDPSYIPPYSPEAIPPQSPIDGRDTPSMEDEDYVPETPVSSEMLNEPPKRLEALQSFPWSHADDFFSQSDRPSPSHFQEVSLSRV